MDQETPLFAKLFDLLVYLLSASDKFPRGYRPGLGRRLQEIGLGVLDLLLRARKVGPDERLALLRDADVDLDRLRYTVRLCQELGLLSPKQYQHAAGLLAEVGKLLGTWIKRYNES
jgi:23S rRNA-intervening sequence protein